MVTKIARDRLTDIILLRFIDIKILLTHMWFLASVLPAHRLSPCIYLLTLRLLLKIVGVSVDIKADIENIPILQHRALY